MHTIAYLIFPSSKDGEGGVPNPKPRTQLTTRTGQRPAIYPRQRRRETETNSIPTFLSFPSSFLSRNKSKSTIQSCQVERRGNFMGNRRPITLLPERTGREGREGRKNRFLSAEEELMFDILFQRKISDKEGGERRRRLSGHRINLFFLVFPPPSFLPSLSASASSSFSQALDELALWDCQGCCSDG